MKKVWLIETGSYSDYQIVGVFSTRARAVGVADAMKLNEDSVQEWIVDPAVDELNKDHWQYQVVMLRDGKVERVDRNEHLYDLDVSHFIWDRPNISAYAGKGTLAAMKLSATVWAKDKEHAIKIVNEIRTRMIANHEWGAVGE